jgi:Calcineurin-like phosphoesterase
MAGKIASNRAPASRMDASRYKIACMSCRLMVLLLLFAAVATASAPPTPPELVIAIGDVHGDFDDFSALLQHIGLVDKQNHWAGGKTTLVQVGDLLDRGPKPREVMDLLMALQKEATNDGGRVVPLLGNHEMMNIMGDLRYVTPENYASYADAKSEDRRKSAYEDYLKWRKSHAALLAELTPPFELTEEEWMARHPSGFIEQREAFSPQGNYGKWLRGHAALAQINGVIFLHGGLSPSVASLKLDAINSHIRDEIGTFDSSKKYMLDQGLILPFFNLQEMVSVAQAEITAEKKSKVLANPELDNRLVQFLQFPNWLSVRVDGPLWFRGYDRANDQDGGSEADKILESFKVNHVVVGHTVQKEGRIRARFGGKVFLIDTGMLHSYYPGGNPSALKIEDDGKFTAEYMDQEVVLLDPAKASPATKKLGGQAAGSAEWTLTEFPSSSTPAPASAVAR